MNPCQGVHRLVHRGVSALASPTSFLMVKARKVPRKHRPGKGPRRKK